MHLVGYFYMMNVFFWVILRRLNYLEENIQHTEHGESLKLRIFVYDLYYDAWIHEHQG